MGTRSSLDRPGSTSQVSPGRPHTKRYTGKALARRQAWGAEWGRYLHMAGVSLREGKGQ